MDKQKIINRAGFIGGGLFFVLNIVTNGQVPGGFVGGLAGGILGAGLAWIVLALVPSKQQATAKKS